MKIGLDVHKVIDKYPRLFSLATHKWLDLGWEIHIVTGQERSVVEPELHGLNVVFTHFFSIVDYHLEVGTEMWDDDPRGSGWWMHKEDWLPSKGRYARQAGLDVHYDDSIEYAQFFPDTCTFIWVRNNFEKTLHI
jgi:hypothetical protein